MVVTLHFWGSKLSTSRLLIFSDNLAMVFSIKNRCPNSIPAQHSTTDIYIYSISLWPFSCLPDLLSPWHSDHTATATSSPYPKHVNLQYFINAPHAPSVSIFRYHLPATNFSFSNLSHSTCMLHNLRQHPNQLGPQYPVQCLY